MMEWLTAAKDGMTPSVLVTVAIVEGSGPREPGAKMLVTSDAQFDTIGGGHLEMRAVEIARAMLATPPMRVASTDAGISSRIERFSLGPSLGQCCGGVVHLAFEMMDGDADEMVNCLHRRWEDKQDSWRLIPLDAAEGGGLYDALGTCLAGQESDVAKQFERQKFCYVIHDGTGKRWLVDPCISYRSHLMLFGAGHVGAALVRAMAELPCQITWVDAREELFPKNVPANVNIEVTDMPEALVNAAPPETSFLVMTHSHALDQRITEAILRRDNVGWFGLIGSKTKRVLFEHRLRERGIPAQRLAHMVCPIGLVGINGKEPAVIAVSVCAQLLQHWETVATVRCGGFK